jgi:hypothetical protein
VPEQRIRFTLYARQIMVKVQTNTGSTPVNAMQSAIGDLQVRDPGLVVLCRRGGFSGASREEKT